MKNTEAKTDTKISKDGNEGYFSFLLSKKIFFLLSVLSGFSSYFLFKLLTTPPDLPYLDLNAYWGPYPMNVKPDLSIRNFEIEFSDVMINDLKERLLHRRPFPAPLEDTGFSYGFNSHFLTRVLDYWQNKYDFKEREFFLNKYSHYITKIQGLDIHYMHIKPNVSGEIKVVPLLLLHGWPATFREFYDIIPKLTTPNPGHNIVFEVIVPSMPGFGYSQAPNRPGFSLLETAGVIANLMKRIGHEQYYIQGGDVGHVLGSLLATLFPKNILGFHTDWPVILFNPMAYLYVALGSLWPRLVVEPELKSRLYPWTTHAQYLLEESGYFHLQATKPDTIGIALTDSPAGLAAYVLEKFSTWTNPANRKASDGNLLDKFMLTHLLDIVTVYWSTNSITTSMRLYAETFNKRYLGMRMDEIPTEVPTWGIKLKHKLYFQPDCVLKLKYKNYLHTIVLEDGGHFSVMEHPDFIAEDILYAVDTFQQFHRKRAGPQTVKNNFETATTIYDFTVKDIYGNDVKLDKYKGYVVLIVNVASQCGLTDTNYQQLNELYDKYASRDLRILAFPCNQFSGQEPGTMDEILKFTRNRGVKFDLFEKIDVNGENAHPLWKFLKRVQSGTFGDFIKWNFSKFIVDKNGVPVERFGPHVKPIDLEPYLAKYW